MSISELAAFFLFLLPLVYSPGPGNTFFALNGAAHGLIGIVPALAGYHVSGFLITLAIGFGLSVGIFADPVVALCLRLASAGYMFWIAWKCFRASGKTQVAGVAEADRRGPRPSFWAGAALALLNPKAYGIIAAMLGGFLGSNPSAVRILTVTTIFIANNMVAFVFWAAFGQWLGRRLGGGAARRLYGAAFAAVGFWMLR
jgi:threonine/homoserine/homoserine lactone efflux protein